jgi:hypothetical protein
MLKPESKFFQFDISLTHLILRCRSTFLKQMKFMHNRGFKIEEKRRLISFIYRQIFSIVQSIYKAMETLDIPFEKSQNEV